ncbi:MAG TPA: hypothetical protein VLA71_16325 [Algoriphagus sp.]|nr:hypothetical protein [Algoriphagus sp.]
MENLNHVKNVVEGLKKAGYFIVSCKKNLDLKVLLVFAKNSFSEEDYCLREVRGKELLRVS